MTDAIEHPAHYTQGEIECKDVCKWLGFYPGNVIKYIWRHKQKGGAEDLKKACQYLEFMMTSVSVVGDTSSALRVMMAATAKASQTGDFDLNFFVCRWLAALDSVQSLPRTPFAEQMFLHACVQLKSQILHTIKQEYDHGA